MPAFPEFRDAPGTVRPVEVLREMEADHEPKANRHVGVRREVEVNLEHVRESAPPRIEDARRVGRKHAVGNDSHLVREENLFGKTEAEKHETTYKVFNRMLSCRKFLGDCIVANNRACHQLREKRHVACECRKVLDRRSRPAIDVYRVTHGLERIERNAHRQKHRHDRERFATEHGRKIVYNAHAEHVVLEKAECTEIDGDCRPQGRFPLECACARRRDEPPRNIDDQRAAEHQKDKPRFKPAVKDVAENRNEQVQVRMFRPELEQHKIANQERRQEIEKENLGGEDH